MVSSGFSCQILSNCRAKSETFRDNYNRLPITFQMCFMEERSDGLSVQESFRKAGRIFLETRAVCDRALSWSKLGSGWRRTNANETGYRMSSAYRCAVNDYRTRLAIKVNGTPDHIRLVEGLCGMRCKGKFPTLPWTSANTYAVFASTQYGKKLVIKVYMYLASANPNWSI